MMRKKIIETSDAPAASGAYSQAIQAGKTVYISGQLPLAPGAAELADSIEKQIIQVLDNLSAMAKAAGGSLDDVVKLNIFMTDLSHFPLINEMLPRYFSKPYPARTTIGVLALPRGAMVEMDVILVLP